MIKVYNVNLWKKELPTFPEHLSSPSVFIGVRVVHLFSFLCCPIMFWVPSYGVYSILPYSDHLQLAEDYVTVEVYLQQDID
jgi:hypothetical protein